MKVHFEGVNIGLSGGTPAEKAFQVQSYVNGIQEKINDINETDPNNRVFEYRFESRGGAVHIYAFFGPNSEDVPRGWNHRIFPPVRSVASILDEIFATAITNATAIIKDFSSWVKESPSIDTEK